jgi:hypothetical protein
MPLYQTNNVKAVRTGLGTTAEYPDVPGIDHTTWRWVSRQYGIFETKTNLVGVQAAPSHYPGLFAIARKRSDGKTVIGAGGVHDNETNTFAVVSPADGVLIPGKDVDLIECSEAATNAVQVLPKTPVEPSQNDLDWTEGMPKEMTPEELVPQVAALTDSDLLAILAKREAKVTEIEP